MSRLLCLVILLSVSAPEWISANDAFDRHLAGVLEGVVGSVDPIKELSGRDAAGLRTLSAGITTPAIVVVTQEGNLVKALVSWAFRKSPDGAAPTPVLMIERFVTYDRARENQTLAAGKDVMLFPGFAFNFDIGQVVPAGQGEDVVFNDARKLATAGTAEMFPLNGSALPEDEAEDYDPTDHDGVLPRDFAGLWDLNADGRWVGTLELTYSEERGVTGEFTSEDTQSTYEVAGHWNPALPSRVKLMIAFPASTVEFVGHIWTTDKSRIAGTATMIDRDFGFVAKRRVAE
jgi:hypothetical protein